MNQVLGTVTLVIELLLIASLVAVVTRRLRLPYTVALVAVGLLLTSAQAGRAVELTPQLILALFVPPLVFEAAFHIELRQLRENLVALLVLTVPGVLLATLITGLVVAAGVNLPLLSALVFGALMSATDPVAVVALFRAIGVPRQLTFLVESESLFNDGTSIVIFNVVLAAALPAVELVAAGPGEPGAGFNLAVAVLDFARVSLGGVGIGLGLGWLVSRLIAQLDDYLIETTLTTVLAFGSYLVAESLHVSGVLAVVAAGIVNGNIGPRGMSPTTRIVLFNFWEYLAFVTNSLVFLLIGLDVNIRALSSQLGPIGVAVAGVLVSRAVTVYGLAGLLKLLGRGPSLRYQHVLFWGGLRGAIGLALALSLPPAVADRDLLRVMAFGVVLFTLLAQGTTMQFLLRGLKLVDRPPHVVARETRLGRLLAAQAGLHRLGELRQEGSLSNQVWAGLREEYNQASQRLSNEMDQLLAEHSELERDILIQARREALRAERSALGDAQLRGLISEDVHRQLAAEVDRRLEALEVISRTAMPAVEGQK